MIKPAEPFLSRLKSQHKYTPDVQIESNVLLANLATGASKKHTKRGFGELNNQEVKLGLQEKVNFIDGLIAA